MRLAVSPTQVELSESGSMTIEITVTNTESVIAGYHLRILGADPSWVRLDAENLSLFPDTSETVRAHIEIPRGVGAGDRRIAVQAREVTPPHAVAVAEIELVVPGRDAVTMSLSPLTVTCGKRGRFSVVAANTGNTPASVAPVGTDPESMIEFAFVPEILELAPGEHVITDLRTTARRRWFGTPVVRPFSLAAVSPDERGEMVARAAATRDAAKQAKRADRRARKRAAAGLPIDPAPTTPAAPKPPEPLAQGTIIQKPRVGRGLLSLLSLLLAVTVFAVVITIAMSRLVGVSAADRDLAIRVAQARDQSTAVGTSSLGGTVAFLTGGAPAADVAVEVFEADDLNTPMVSTATDAEGTWTVSGMPAGHYKLRFRGAGYAELWYPNALTGADAKAVSVEAGQSVGNLTVTLGGLPATVTGTVSGADVAGAVLTVEVAPEFLVPANAGGTDNAAGADDTAVGAGDAGPDPAGTGAVLRTVPIASDGQFRVADLPSPAVYDLVVTKSGYAAARQRVDLTGGETRSGIQLSLRSGDGLISGTVTGPDGSVGGATITAISGDTTVRTMSLTEDGSFTLRGLKTPATYTVTVTKQNFAPVTSTLTLTDSQKLRDVLMSLSASATSIHGDVTMLSDGGPASGVTVTIETGSDTPVTTVTQSGATAGSWSASGLPVPGAYTITFSRADLQPQTVSVALNSAGVPTSGADADGAITVAMRSATGEVTGIVYQRGDSDRAPVGEATVTLSSADHTYTVPTASVPAKDLGSYYLGNVEPGTYTMSVVSKGTRPTTVIVSVTAGQRLTYDPVLIPPASITGSVTGEGGIPPGTAIYLYVSSEYPAKVYAQSTIDSDGRYRFDGVDAPQSYVIEARSQDGSLVSRTVVLDASKAAMVDLTIPPTAPADAGPAGGVGTGSASTAEDAASSNDPAGAAETAGTTSTTTTSTTTTSTTTTSTRSTQSATSTSGTGGATS